MKWTVRTDSNFMDHSIDLKRLKSNVHMLYLCIQRSTLTVKTQMKFSISGILSESVFYDNIDLQRKRYILNCNLSRYSMGHPDFTVWNIELFLVV